MVGEMSILDDREKNTTSVVTESDSTLIAFPNSCWEMQSGLNPIPSPHWLCFSHGHQESTFPRPCPLPFPAGKGRGHGRGNVDS